MAPGVGVGVGAAGSGVSCVFSAFAGAPREPADKKARKNRDVEKKRHFRKEVWHHTLPTCAQGYFGHVWRPKPLFASGPRELQPTPLGN